MIVFRGLVAIIFIAFLRQVVDFCFVYRLFKITYDGEKNLNCEETRNCENAFHAILSGFLNFYKRNLVFSVATRKRFPVQAGFQAEGQFSRNMSILLVHAIF